MSTPFQNMHDGDMKFIGDDGEKGIYGKYVIGRNDGKRMKPGFRFLLSPDNDPAALEALRTYQKETTDRALAIDLKNIIIAIESYK